ncbi:MAG: hypothetical protein Q7Q73_10935, partial [Verrucomicrobiota bacterium JB024]|nr:hypothetical protein [Verrucomicrobiota bacterium JB024]
MLPPSRCLAFKFHASAGAISFLGLRGPDPQQAQPALSMLRIVSAITENELSSFSVIAERKHQNWVATIGTAVRQKRKVQR